MAADAGLEARLLVGTENGVLRAQGVAFPGARIQGEHRSGLFGQVRIPGAHQYVYRQGLMASVARIRHTVLRLIGLSGFWARTVTTASDGRLSGGSVSATSSQATALTSACSTGENGGTPPSQLIVQAEVACGPSLSPVADRVGVQTHLRSRLHMR